MDVRSERLNLSPTLLTASSAGELSRGDADLIAAVLGQSRFRTGCFDSPNTASKEFTATHFGAMEARKRKAEVVDLTADHELACRPPKRPTLERHCVIDLSPTVVDLASDAEAAAAPAISCQPHKSLPPSPQVIDSNDDAPADRMALADGHNAALAEISQDPTLDVRGSAASEGCPGPETPGNMDIANADFGVNSGIQDAGQLSARAAAVAPAVSAFFGRYAGASNPFHAAAVLMAATGVPLPQLLQARLKTAPQPPMPATPILTAVPLPVPSAAAAAPLETVPQVPLPAILRAVPLSVSSAGGAAPLKAAPQPPVPATPISTAAPRSVPSAAAAALLETAPQPPVPAVLQCVPRSAAAVQPSAAAAALPQQLLQLKGGPSPGSASGMRAAEEAAPCVAAGSEAAQSPQLQSLSASAAPVASTAVGARSEPAALPVAGQLPHLRPVKVPSRIEFAQEGAPSDPALQAAVALSQAQCLNQEVAFRGAGVAASGLARGDGPSAAANNSDEEPSSAESSSGMLLAHGEAPAQVIAAGVPEGRALDKLQSLTQISRMSNTSKAVPGQAAADSPHSSVTQSTLIGSAAQAPGAAVCNTSAGPPGRAACGIVMGIVRDITNSHIRPREDARFGGIASITGRVSAALASGDPASADVNGPVITPNVAPCRSPSASVAAAAAADIPAATGAPIAAAAPGRGDIAAAAAGARGLGHLDAPEQPVAHTVSQGAASPEATTAGQALRGVARSDAETPAESEANPGQLSRGVPCSRAAPENAGITGVTGVPGAHDASAAPSERVSDGSGVADPGAAAPRASDGPYSSATFTDSDVAPRADAGTELQSKNRTEVGVAGGSMAGAGSSMAGAGSSSAGGLPRRIRSPPQRLEPTFHGKKHTMAAVGTIWTAEDAWPGSRRGRGRRNRGGGRLGGTIPSMFRSNKSGRGRGRPKGMPAPEQFLREDAAVPSATRAEEPQPRGLQRSAATEGPGQAAGGSKLPSVLQVESSGGDAKSLQRPAAADVRKRRRRARFVFPEDSEAYVAAEEAGCVQQPSGSDDIWLCSDDGNDEGEEVAPEEGACCRPSATALVARQSINGLGSNAANAAASPAGVLIKEEPTGEPCSQAAAQGGLCSLSDVVERWSEAYPSELKEVHAKRQEQRDAVAAFDQALRSNSRSANLASTIANGDAPPKAAEGVSDVDRAAAAAAASVVGALRRKQACRQPVIKAEAMDVSREINDGRFVATPARSTAVIMEESPAGVPNRAAEGPPEQAPSRVPNRAAAGRPDQAAAKAPEQAGSSSRAAAAPLAGTSGLGAKPLHRKLTARKITAGARPPAPPHRAAVPAACASLQQLHVEVIAALSEEDTDDELVHEIYSEEVHAMLQQALFDHSRKRNPKTGLELLPLSHATIPGRAAQQKAEEAVQAYFVLSAEEKRAYMRARVEVFEISAEFADHPAQSFNVATMRHLDPGRQLERGLRAVRDMPAFTLMGEYCGVVKTGDAAEAASAEDPMGFGGLKNDKLKDFCHSHPDKNVRPQGLWSEGMELVVDPCRAGNALRYINDYQGMPGGLTKNVATVEVFDHDTLRPHILFFTVQAVAAGQELLMDYGEQFRRFILSEGNRAKSLVAARKAAAEARREVETANAKTAEAMEEVMQARDVVQLALQEAEDAHMEAKLARKEARKAKREKAELENLLKKHGIRH